MPEFGRIRYAAGDSTPGKPCVRVRIETDELGEPQDLSIALGDVTAFVTLLPALSGKAGTGRRPARQRNGRFRRPSIPWGWARPRLVKPSAAGHRPDDVGLCDTDERYGKARSVAAGDDCFRGQPWVELAWNINHVPVREMSREVRAL
jgi:hypothetical protein